MSVISLACLGDPGEDLPRVVGLAGQTELNVDWPWCEAPIPTLHGCGEFSSLADIGRDISEQHVCTLITALHGWLAVREYESFNNVRVCRVERWAEPPPPQGEPIAAGRPQLWFTQIAADIPEHGVWVLVSLQETTGDITFNVEPFR